MKFLREKIRNIKYDLKFFNKLKNGVWGPGAPGGGGGGGGGPGGGGTEA